MRCVSTLPECWLPNQRPLGRRQPHLFAVTQQPVILKIDLQVVAVQRLGLAPPLVVAFAPQQHFDASKQLFLADRRGQILVRAQSQRRNFIAERAGIGNHHERDHRAAANLAAQLQPVQVRQPQPQNQQVERFLLPERQRLRTVDRPYNTQTRRFQAPAQQNVQSRVCLGDKYTLLSKNHKLLLVQQLVSPRRAAGEDTAESLRHAGISCVGGANIPAQGRHGRQGGLAPLPGLMRTMQRGKRCIRQPYVAWPAVSATCIERRWCVLLS
jgi:hypothetical protein